MSETPLVTRRMIWALIANMIGDEDQTIHQSSEITSEDMPIDCEEEGFVLDAIYWHRTEQIAPTRESIILRLKKTELIAEPKEFVDRILSQEQVGMGVKSLSTFVRNWLDEQKGVNVAARIKSIMSDRSADYPEKWKIASRVLAEAGPLFRHEEIYGEEDFLQMLYDETIKIVDEKKKHGVTGAHLPFKAAWSLFPRLSPSESTQIMAKEGWGKTTLASIIAEFNAHKLNIPIDVVVFYLETSSRKIAMRQFGRYAKIPYQMIEDGLIDLREEKWSAKYKEMKAFATDRANRTGYLYNLFLPETTLDAILAHMERFRYVSAAAGRHTLFLLDYIQEIDQSGYGRMQEREILQMFANRLTRRNRRLGSHLIMFAQEGDTEGQAFGSKWITKKNQLSFRLARKQPEGGVMQDWKIQGKKDAFGRDRYWHRKGDILSGDAELVLTKANDTRRDKIDLLFEGAMNIVVQDPRQIKKMPKKNGAKV